MKISFDLDDTLIPYSANDFPTEKRNILHKIMGIEPIRRNTKQLFQTLKRQNHQVGIYTTSYRSVVEIQIWCWSYGIFPDFIINEYKNRKALKKLSFSTAKHPPSFQIHWHIDDSEGVKLEGQKFNFQTIIVAKSDQNWIQTILKKIGNS